MLTMVNLSSVLAKVSHAKCTAHVCLAPEASVTVVGVYCSCECMARKNVYGYVRFALRRFPHVTVGFLLSLERSPSRSLRILAHVLLPLIPSLTPSLSLIHSLTHSLKPCHPLTTHTAQQNTTTQHSHQRSTQQDPRRLRKSLTRLNALSRGSVGCGARDIRSQSSAAAPEESNATKRSLQRALWDAARTIGSQSSAAAPEESNATISAFTSPVSPI